MSHSEERSLSQTRINRDICDIDFGEVYVKIEQAIRFKGVVYCMSIIPQ